MGHTTLRFGLIGKKLTHSFSKKYFTDKFAEHSLPLSYELFEIPAIERVVDIWDAHPQLVGMNVTNPYKEVVMPFLDELSDAAREIGAVNTIHFSNGKKIGYNTDVLGFRDSLLTLLDGEIVSSALILGTGGASKAVHYVLGKLGVRQIHFASRTPSTPAQRRYEALKASGLAEYSLIVNTTPLGTYPNVETAPDLPYEQIGPQHRVFDLVYNPEKPLFLAKAEAQGARIQNGLPMLVGQAEGAWAIWKQDVLAL